MPVVTAEETGRLDRPSRPVRRVVAALGAQCSAARVVLAAALVLWVLALPSLAHARLSQYGLLATHGGPELLVASLLVLLAFCLATRAQSIGDALACVLGLIAVTRATASIVTDLPLFTWTFKHIGVIDHLTSTGTLARNVDIYNNWPGFFTAMAWFSQLTGVEPVTLARWFPIVADLAIAAGMYAVSRAFGQTQRVALVAAFGIQAANWVGQDYFSPQALGFILGLAVLALLLRSPQSRAAGWISIPIFLAITISHQLTPFWLCAVALVLGFTRRVTPRWVGLAYLVIAVGYALLNLKALTPYGLFTSVDPVSNAHSNIATAGNAGRSFTSLAAKVPAVLLWLGTAALALRGRRRREAVWVPVVLAFAAFPLLAGQSYGGEAIFRVYLYSLPGCLLLVAPAVTTVLSRRRAVEGMPRLGWRTGVVAWAISPVAPVRAARALGRGVALALVAIVLATSMQAYYGSWFINVVDRDGLVAEQHLLATAPTDSWLLPLTTGIAERPDGRYALFAGRNRFYDVALALVPGIVGSHFTPKQVSGLTYRLNQLRVPVYVIVTRQMRRYSQYYGLFPPGAIDSLVGQLAGSRYWRTVTNTSSLSIFELSPR